MKKNMDWDAIRDELIEILKEAEQFHSENYDKTCFLSAYQLAVLLYKRNKNLVINSSFFNNIGGKGDGSKNSLAQYIALSLSRDIKRTDEASLKDEVEMAFFNTSGLEQFSFLDEKGIISQPSNTCFSMFRYKR